MPDRRSIATIRAAIDLIAPPVDGAPGALDLGVDRHVIEAMEGILAGMADLTAALLDAYAAEVRPGSTFTVLTPEEGDRALRLLCAEEALDIQDAAGALLLFTYGGIASEWSGYDPQAGTLDPPALWEEMGFHGPVPGHPEYREGG